MSQISDSKPFRKSRMDHKMNQEKHHSWSIIIFFVMVLFVSSRVHSGQPGKLYVVGMGPAGPDLTAPRALKVIEEADILLCSPRMPERFARFGMRIDPAKVAFNPWEGIIGKKADDLKQSNYNAWKSQAEKQVKKVQDFLMGKLREGKTVVLMDGGDPCVYGPSLQYLLSGFDENLFEVIPGMGAFNAASAALKRNMIPDDARFVLLSSPESLFGESWDNSAEILKDLSRYEGSMVLYMALSSMPDLVEKMKAYYPPEYPIAVVYFAGYADKEKVLKSRLDRIVEDLKIMDEKWLGLVVMGKCLD